MAASLDVLVIGGGIIGLTAAYELASAGLTVEVCDRGDLGREASWAGAGIIPPGNFEYAATPLDRLRAYSSSRFPAFAKMLRHATGIDPGYLTCGGVEFLEPADEYVLSLWQDERISFAKLDPQALAKKVRGISKYSGTPYWLPGMAQVRNPRLIKALIALCKSKGVVLSRNRLVESLVDVGRGYGCASFENGELSEAAFVVLATGAFSEHLLTSLECPLGIRPVRGQIVLYRGSPQLLEQILIQGKQYMVPRGDGYILVGSTEEPDSGFDDEPTLEGLNLLRNFANRLLPALTTTPEENCWAGLRPGSRDGLPSIGFVPGFRNVLAAVGHYRSGIQLSLGTATMIADLIVGRPATIDPAPFRLDRPLQQAPKLAFRS